MFALWMACAQPDPAARPGELTVVQLDLDGPSIGASTLVVSPEGQVLLVDVGNDRHDRAVLRALERYTGDRAVDYLLLTHAHADHIGGLSDLADDLTLRGAVIERGPYDLGSEAANLEEWAEVCALALPTIALCEGPTPAPCEGGEGPWPAASCPGLADGDLADPDDSGPGGLDLGGATLELLAVDGFVGAVQVPLGYDRAADENARSVVSRLRFGDFTLLMPGDLTGGGKESPDMEAALLAQGLPGAVDALLLGHHGISSSTSEPWVEALFPADGLRREALVGANRGYLDAPSDEVLARLNPRLGGGQVRVTEPGRLAGPGHFCDADGDIVLRVDAGGELRFDPGPCDAP